jgi:hypothetical protein
VAQKIRSFSPEIRNVFAHWLASERRAGVRLIVLEGLTLSGKSTVTKEPFAVGTGLSGNVHLDDFLRRPVPETTAYVDAIDSAALKIAIRAAIASTSLAIVEGAIAWPFSETMTTIAKECVRRVYIKRMRKLNPDFWVDEDSLFDRSWWPPTDYHRSIYKYHAEQQPWLAADLVLERIEGDCE